VPNLNTDRLVGLSGCAGRLNIRRLMYQTLICAVVLRDHSRRLRPALDAQHLERAANALIDRVGRDRQPRRDLLGGEMLVDQPQAFALASSESGNTLRRHCIGRRRGP
jgi:hypothetical protein